MKKISYLAALVLIIFSCGGNTENNTATTENEITLQEETQPSETTAANSELINEEGTPEEIVEPSEDWLCIPGIKVGKINANTSEADLKALFLPENVITEDISVAGGLIRATRVYPDTDNEAVVFWQDEDAPNNPERVVFEKANAQWKTNQGIAVGTTLEELEKLNGGPLKLYGFEWDYSGMVTSWEGGNLENELKIGEKFALQLGSNKAPGNSYGDILGEEEFMSNLPAIRERELKVISISIIFN